MRRAFTLIELLAIIVVIGTMVGVAVLNFRSGQSAARLKGSVRDAFATIRHARSMALLSKQPSIITYSTVEEDGEQCARIEVHTAKIFSDSAVTTAETIEGETINLSGETEEERKGPGEKDGEAPAIAEGDGKSVEEMLFEPIDTEMFRGISLKVIKEGDEIDEYEQERAKPKISVFSNVDFLLGKFNQSKKEDEAKKAADTESSTTLSGSASEAQEAESFVWEVNGRTEAHKVWFYRAGTRFDEGLCISVDRFGAAKVLSDEDED